MPYKRPEADFQAVHAAVEGGMLLSEALRALRVSQTGYRAWAYRTGVLKRRAPVVQPPSAVFKAVENEFRATPTLADICARHGITRRQLYDWRQQTGGLPK